MISVRGPKARGVACIVAAALMATIGGWELVVFEGQGVLPALVLLGFVVMFTASAVVAFRRAREEEVRGFEVIPGKEQDEE